METKPYNLQSPEQIAKDYGGNKQKIAEAMQMGLIDPTAGTMAGMFIDRMRSAAQQEATPQQTVAQQVMAPQPQMPMGAPQGAPPAPAGLGATPQAAAMPPMGAAPPMGMPAPQGEMPMMAMGGMVPPYASGGGLSDMPLPDGMFDEPSNGGFGDGYAGGGIVAFLTGGEVEDKNKNPKDVNGDGKVDGNDILVSGQKDDEDLSVLQKRGMMFGSIPSGYGGYDDTLGGNLETINQEAPRSVKRYEQYQTYLDKMLDPEERKKSKKEDMWLALGQIGARMATTPGSLLQAAGAGIGEALPGIAAAAKERRGEERAVIRDMMDQERIGNKEVMERANMALDMLKGYNVNEKSFQDQNFTNVLTRLGFDTDIVKANIMAGAGIREAIIGADASRFGTLKGFEAEQLRADSDLTTAVNAFLTSPQGLAGITKARKTGMADEDYISSVRRALSGGKTLRYDSKGNPI